MKTLLQINSSLFGNGGQSSQLADRFVAQWKARNPRGIVIVRDLAREPVPHLTAERFGAFIAKPEERTFEQQAVIRYSDALIDELKRADVIVLGLPMYNFGVPSALKAYFDHVARAGETFSYTANGPVGLLLGKQVHVFATRGGAYVGTAKDTQTAFVRDFFNFVGIDRVEFVYAEKLAMGDEHKRLALSNAHAKIDAVVAANEVEALAA
jgi:FMN-dependent NADH-azoreductase